MEPGTGFVDINGNPMVAGPAATPDDSTTTTESPDTQPGPGPTNLTGVAAGHWELPAALPDAEATSSHRKAAELDRAAQAVEAELARPTRPQAEKNNKTSEELRELDVHRFVEKYHLAQSNDPRPTVVAGRGFTIVCAYRDGFDPAHRPGMPLVLRARNPESPMTAEEAQQYYLDHIKGRVPPRRVEEFTQPDADTDTQPDADTDDGRGTGEERLILMTD
jgi:hypothetical protein